MEQVFFVTHQQGYVVACFAMSSTVANKKSKTNSSEEEALTICCKNIILNCHENEQFFFIRCIFWFISCETNEFWMNGKQTERILGL